jgi:hypothetical protein
VGFIARDQRAATGAGEKKTNWWPVCPRLPGAAALRRFNTRKEVFSSPSDSMQFSDDPPFKQG